MRRVLLLSLCLAGCGQSVPMENVVDNQASLPDIVTPQAVPVRIGDFGPSLAACTAAGTTRHLDRGQSLPVRSAPFDNADQIGAVASGGRFFVCSRTIDQKWLGIVYNDAFALAAECGVSDPVSKRKAYDGPCRSGWVSAPFVKLNAGAESTLPETNQAAVVSNVAESPAG